MRGPAGCELVHWARALMVMHKGLCCPTDEECEQGAQGPDESLEGLAGELETCLDVRLMIFGAIIKVLSPSPVLRARAIWHS
jgi:hypothetical protein